MIIDAKDLMLGRLSSFAAKQLLLGNTIDIINCEECVVSGKKQNVLANYIRRIDRKAPGKGPYFYRRPDMFVKRSVRGMLPFKRSRGRAAFKNIKCHIGMPDSFKSEKTMAIGKADIGKLKSADYIKIKEICKAVGWKP
ncbi:50S ribosomal protein L13 [Candidatus Woesearchaeota archaeon]|nr:50S ribosomal protein L13 [Candidatus Woesearchaeota archaeon]